MAPTGAALWASSAVLDSSGREGRRQLQRLAENGFDPSVQVTHGNAPRLFHRVSPLLQHWSAQFRAEVAPKGPRGWLSNRRIRVNLGWDRGGGNQGNVRAQRGFHAKQRLKKRYRQKRGKGCRIRYTFPSAGVDFRPVGSRGRVLLRPDRGPSVRTPACEGRSGVPRAPPGSPTSPRR